MEQFSVYILYSQTADRYYVGHTSDIHTRLKSHNRTDELGGKYTRKNGPWELVYLQEGFTSRAEAVKREREIKRWKSRRRIKELIEAQPAESRLKRD